MERAVHSAIDADGMPLEDFAGVPGMAHDELLAVNRNAAAASVDDDDNDDRDGATRASRGIATSILSTCASLAWSTLCVSKDIAVNMYYTKEPMHGALDDGDDADRSKKRQ